MDLAPIAVFAFNRPTHLRRCLESLVRNPEAAQSQVFLFLDHPVGTDRTPTSGEVERVARSFAEAFARFQLVVRPYNFGLAWNIIQGVSEVLGHHESVIVLEDDLELSPDFLRYMNEALNKYRNEPRVASVHAYVYPGFRSDRAFWMRGADCWGWGTWRRVWERVEWDGARLLEELERRRLTWEFDGKGAYPYTQMLRDQILGKNNSWAVRWHAWCFLERLLTLQPPWPLVRNTGNDGSGQHSGYNQAYQVQQPGRFDFPLPPDVREDKELSRRLLWRGQKRIMKSLIKVLYHRLVPRKIQSWIRPGPWQGDYPSWQKALEKSRGYDQESIAAKCLAAARAVYEGRAVAERDSVLFDRWDVRWPALASLLMGLERGDPVVVDFGGAFGTALRMFRPYLPERLEKWIVVEQPLYVHKAATYTWEPQLQFTADLKKALDEAGTGVFFASSSLQYLERPDQVIAAVRASRVRTVVLDRVALVHGPNRITVQTVPKQIYEAVYPAWFFNEKWLLALFEPEFELVTDFPSIDEYNLPHSYCKGFLLRRRDG